MKKNFSFFYCNFFIFCFVILLINETVFPEEITYAKAIVTTSSGIKIPVEMADTFGKRRLGLGKRKILEKNWGMLFVFDKRKKHSFWMKDMNFPLDIIWLDNHRIVHIMKNVQPAKFGETPTILKPLAPANFVLEIAAGRANELNLKQGDFLSYKF